MGELTFLVFDDETAIKDVHDPNGVFSRVVDDFETGRRFLYSLGDEGRDRFLEYCTGELSNTVEIFAVSGLWSFNYVFCERHSPDNITVYLAEDIRQFHCLMSPASISRLAPFERIPCELILLVGHLAESRGVPESLSLLGTYIFPVLFRAIAEDGQGYGSCDILHTTEEVVETLRSSPICLFTNIIIRCSEPESFDRMIELSTALYVHVLTAVITVLMTMSVDHVINVELESFAPFFGGTPLGVDVIVSAFVRDTARYSNDSNSLTVLATSGSPNELPTAVAAVVAYIAGMDTSIHVDKKSDRITVTLSIDPSKKKSLPEFKYRNPYSMVRDMVMEVVSLEQALGMLPE